MNAALETGIAFELSETQIDIILTSVVPFVAPKDVSVINGISLSWNGVTGAFAACATDGSRLALFEENIGAGSFEETVSVIAPVAMFEALAKVWRKKTRSNIRIGILKDRIAFRGGKIEEQMFDLVPGEYPRYYELFPRDYKHTLELLPVKEDKYSKEKSETGYTLGDLALEINQIRKFSPAASVTLKTSAGDANVNVGVAGTTHWNFSAIIDGVLDYGNVKIAFNPKFLADVLSGMSGLVRIQMNGELKPAVFTSLGTPGLRHLLMPVQVK